MTRRIFITGTDTDVGKTLFSVALVKALQDKQKSVRAFKPIAAGCEKHEGVFKNTDALNLINALSIDMEYQQVNPIALEPAIAPHIAADKSGVSISVKALQQVCPLNHYHEDYLVIEGAGGWLVPLNQQETFADYVEAESLEVILVIGLKLGCLNHALLTQENIMTRGLKLVGWVANHIDPKMDNQQDNIETLKQQIKAPLIAEIPFLVSDNPLSTASNYVKIDALEH
jgi:dethiobiotin synthetase